MGGSQVLVLKTTINTTSSFFCNDDQDAVDESNVGSVPSYKLCSLLVLMIRLEANHCTSGGPGARGDKKKGTFEGPWCRIDEECISSAACDTSETST